MFVLSNQHFVIRFKFNLVLCIIKNWRWQKNYRNMFLKSWMSFIKKLKLIFKSSAVPYRRQNKPYHWYQCFCWIYHKFVSKSPPVLIAFPKLWKANIRSMVLDFRGEQNMTTRRTIIQWNESRTSCSPYSNNFWLPCICGKWTSSEKPREHHCICFQSPSVLHNTL